MTDITPSIPSSYRIALLAVLSFSSVFFLYKSRRLRCLRHLSTSTTAAAPAAANCRGKIFFASQSGTSKTLAVRLAGALNSSNLPFDLVDPIDYEPEDLAKETLVLIVASTWEDGKPPPNASFLARWLAESAADFRVGRLLLSNCKFAVFGVGSRVYGNQFNAAARDFLKWMKALGGAEIVPISEADVDCGDVDRLFDSWSEKLVKRLKGEDDGSLGASLESDEFDFDGSEEEDEEEVLEVVDLEDIAGKAPSRKSSGSSQNSRSNGVKEMVTPVIRANLEKQVTFPTLLNLLSGMWLFIRMWLVFRSQKHK